MGDRHTHIMVFSFEIDFYGKHMCAEGNAKRALQHLRLENAAVVHDMKDPAGYTIGALNSKACSSMGYTTPIDDRTRHKRFGDGEASLVATGKVHVFVK